MPGVTGYAAMGYACVSVRLEYYHTCLVLLCYYDLFGVLLALAAATCARMKGLLH